MSYLPSFHLLSPTLRGYIKPWGSGDRTDDSPTLCVSSPTRSGPNRLKSPRAEGFIYNRADILTMAEKLDITKLLAVLLKKGEHIGDHVDWSRPHSPKEKPDIFEGVVWEEE